MHSHERQQLESARYRMVLRSWCKNIQPFECFVGPKTFIADNLPEIFQLFFSDEMLDGIVDASNEYAKVTIAC